MTDKTEQKLTNLVTKILKERDHSDYSRLSIFPVKDFKYYELYYRSEGQRWPESDIDPLNDLPDFDGLSDRAKFVILAIVSFFLVGDAVVNEAMIRFLLDYIISIKKGKSMPLERINMIISQMSMETIHQGSYTITGLTFVKSMEKLEELLKVASTTPEMRAKIEFSEKWTESNTPAWQRFVANSAMEGIGFVAAFAVIFYFRSINKLKEFVTLNELIAKDEFLHREMCVVQALDELDLTVEDEMPKEVEDVIRQIIRDAVEVEDKFADYLLSENLDDFNKEDLKLYIRCIANSLLAMYGLNAEWDAENPFDWMNSVNMEVKGNMFETNVVAYSNAQLSRMLDWESRAGLKEASTTSHLIKPEDVDF